MTTRVPLEHIESISSDCRLYMNGHIQMTMVRRRRRTMMMMHHDQKKESVRNRRQEFSREHRWFEAAKTLVVFQQIGATYYFLFIYLFYFLSKETYKQTNKQTQNKQWTFQECPDDPPHVPIPSLDRDSGFLSLQCIDSDACRVHLHVEATPPQGSYMCM